VFIWRAVHVIVLSVLAIWQFAKQAQRSMTRRRRVKPLRAEGGAAETRSRPKCRPQGDPEERGGEIVTFEEDVFMPTEPTEDLTFDRGDSESVET